jgi:hypothetical protein
MRILAAKCPVTGKFFSTGVETDAATMISLPRDVQMQSQCSRCGQVHSWKSQEALLLNFLPDETGESGSVGREDRG